MPRERTYTSYGFAEVQWANGGGLVIAVLDGQEIRPDDTTAARQVTVMHQFNDRAELRRWIKHLRRAERQMVEMPTLSVGINAEVAAQEVSAALSRYVKTAKAKRLRVK